MLHRVAALVVLLSVPVRALSADEGEFQPLFDGK
jgi:hypothetical protein